jgi:hypothetical protein
LKLHIFYVELPASFMKWHSGLQTLITTKGSNEAKKNNMGSKHRLSLQLIINYPKKILISKGHFFLYCNIQQDSAFFIILFLLLYSNNRIKKSDDFPAFDMFFVPRTGMGGGSLNEPEQQF